jgi:pimeloyl-ACP methyl ester carboxylesterase
LHGSPQSSAALAARIASLAQRFCVIAPDNPGNGLSDPLLEQSQDPKDYARAVLAFMDALGLSTAGLYGFHTGAVIAAAVGAMAPRRISALALDGLPVWTPQERAELLAHYLPPHPPRWDGGHLWWAWMRLEEQSLFFPWHQHDGAHRLASARAAPERIHANLLDLLDAGDSYRPLYASAFVAEGDTLARGYEGPRLIFAVGGDPLGAHLARLAQLGANATIAHYPDAASADAALTEFFSRHPTQMAPQAPVTGEDGQGLTRGFVEAAPIRAHTPEQCAPAQRIAWRGRMSGAGRPLVLLHDAGGSSHLWASGLAAIAARRPVLALDLPGHGWSRDAVWSVSGEGGVECMARALRPAIESLGVAEAAVTGFHLGGQIALALKARPGLVAKAALIGAPHYSPAEQRIFAAHYPPRAGLSPDGAHVLRAWRYVRLQALGFPWFDTSPEAVRRPPADHLDPEALHRRAIDLLTAGDNADRALLCQFAYPTFGFTERAQAQVFRWPHDPLSAPERVAELRPRAVMDLPADRSRWAQVFADWER